MSHDVNVALRVIGIGSPFAADAVGLQAIERLGEEDSLFPPGTELMALDRPGTTLIPLLEKSRAVILIDAMQSHQSTGVVQKLQLADLLAQASTPSSHSIGVAETLALADALDLLPQDLLIIGVEMGEDLTVDAWYPQLLELIRQEPLLHS